MQSPRFQAILHVTSGRKKKAPEIKSFSHELNSKGVRPFPVWKSRAFGHMEVCSFVFLDCVNCIDCLCSVICLLIKLITGGYGGD